MAKMTKRERYEREYHDANVRVWHVPCPRCQIGVGEMCQSDRGNPTLPHIGRIEAADAEEACD